MQRWDLESGRPERVGKVLSTGEDQRVVLAPDGKSCLAWRAGGSTPGGTVPLQLQELAEGSKPHVLDLKPVAAAFSPDGRDILFGLADGTVGVHSPASPPVRDTFLRHHKDVVRLLAAAPDGRTLASGDTDGHFAVWDLTRKTWRPLHTWRLPFVVNDMAFAPDSRHLALANNNGTIYIVRLRGPE